MNTKHTSLLIVSAFITASFVGLVYIPVETVEGQQIIIVDQGGNGHFLTIQEGVDAANPGDIVRVWAGEYRENIVVSKQISLIGNGSAETIIDGEGRLYTEGVWIGSGNVIIVNFTIKNFYIGITVSTTSGINIRNNTITNNYDGLIIWGDNNIIANNTISYNNNTGLAIAYCTEGNFIYHNRFIENRRHAHYLYGWGPPDTTKNRWNLPYPHGGNYWSDHTEPDYYRGPGQDEPGADGIVDYAYWIGDSWWTYGFDYYPWANPDFTMPRLDHIRIVDSEGTGEGPIEDATVHTEETFVGYAAGFNDTAGYIGDLDVNWSVINTEGAQAFTYPGNGTSSTFDSGNYPGTAVWIAEYAPGINSSVEFTIFTTYNSIRIVDTENTGEAEITDRAVIPGFSITGYAAGFRDIIGYVGDINVTWSVVNEDGAQAYTSPSYGMSSTFYTGDTTGRALWTAEYIGLRTTVVIDIIPDIDQIRIVDTRGTGELEMEDSGLHAGTTVTGYAAAFNHTAGYMGDVPVTWSVTNEDGARAFTTPDNGTSSTFHTGNTTGTAIWTAEYKGMTATVIFTVLPGIDDIRIVDTAGTGENEITGGIIGGNRTIQGHAAGFNHTAGYLGDMNVTWSVTNSGGANASTLPTNGTASTFNSGLEEGSVIWTAGYGSGLSHSVTFVIDVTPPVVTITAPGEGSELSVGEIVVEWSGSDALSGISHYRIRLNDHDWIDVGTTVRHTFIINEPGDHTVTVRAEDNVGNVGEDTVIFTVEAVPTSNYWWLLLLIPVVIAAAFILLYRKRPSPNIAEAETSEDNLSDSEPY